jgi:undecaprenyl diphosphate synthase
MTSSKTPRHVAIIMDGNGRWAAAHGLPRIKGHEQGAESVRAIVGACRDLGISYLTLYAFSVENWVRPPAEVEALMRLLVLFLGQYEKDLHANQTRLRMIGNLADLPAGVQKSLQGVMERTSVYTGRHLILALSYGGRTEIVAAMRQIAEKVRRGELAPADITDKTVAAHLYAPDVPDPDLVIRTSGEMRISNFLLWQISYSELYVTDTLWPDFREKEFRQALENYAGRQRRFGDIKAR